MNIYQWKSQIKNFNDGFESVKPQEEWNENTRINLPRFSKENSIWRLEDLYAGDKEKAIIIVGASPSLKKDVSKLKKLSDDFIIICVNSSLKYLLDNGVKPHYVVCVDSDELDIVQHLDCDSKGITLLAGSLVCPKALDNWKGDIFYAPFYCLTDKKLKRKLRKKLGGGLKIGGNSATSALFIATMIFGSKIVMFVGNEYCFDKEYYVDKKIAKQEKNDTYYPIKDVLGRQRYTLIPLYTYAIWTMKTCNDLSPPGFFIDTSFGILGTDFNKIKVMELNDAIKMVSSAFDTKRSVRDGKIKPSELMKGVKNDKSDVRRFNV